MKAIDLKNVRFERLVAKEPVGRDSRGCVLWKCLCDCGNEIVVSSNKLRTGHTRSCGCLIKTVLKERNKRETEFDLSNEYGIGITTNTHKEFYFDKEDYDLIKDYAWLENDQGYIIAPIDGKNVRLHRLVYKCKEDEILDHRNRKRYDNQKANLRIATRQQNGINRGANRNNRLGVKGVSYDEKNDVYVARIMVNGRTINLGSAKNIDEAKQLRTDAEKLYFGEFAYREEAV